MKKLPQTDYVPALKIVMAGAVDAGDFSVASRIHRILEFISARENRLIMTCWGSASPAV